MPRSANVALRLALAPLLLVSFVAQSQELPNKGMTLAANPAAVCYDHRRSGHLNFDLVVGNPTANKLSINELRGIVFDGRGQMTERRLLWQQSLAMLGPDNSVPANGSAMFFNPFNFNTLQPDSTVRYEIGFKGQPQGATPLSMTVKPQSCVQPHKLILPLSGRILVYDGYDLFSHHRRTEYRHQQLKSLGVTDNGQRFGIDFVFVDAEGNFYRGAGRRNEDWLGWGKPVRAPGAGVVIGVKNDQPDNEVIGTVDRWKPRPFGEDPMSSSGNYVLIHHGGGEVSVLGHLRHGSVLVKAGDRVKAGDVVAQVGNSGASGGVHLHYDRRIGLNAIGAKTLPPYFHQVTVVGSGEAPTGSRGVALNSGDVVVSR